MNPKLITLLLVAIWILIGFICFKIYYFIKTRSYISELNLDFMRIAFVFLVILLCIFISKLVLDSTYIP